MNLLSRTRENRYIQRMKRAIHSRARFVRIFLGLAVRLPQADSTPIQSKLNAVRNEWTNKVDEEKWMRANTFSTGIELIVMGC